MPSNSVLYLTNFSSKTQHGPGALLCAMVKPRRWEHGDGKVLQACPALVDFEEVHDACCTEEAVAVYRQKCKARFLEFYTAGKYQPGQMLYIPLANSGNEPWLVPRARAVVSGDTLCCACARPDSPQRKHECHIEWLAPFLRRAGWRVMLYGKEVV